jgi:hypothetical protein
MKLKIEKIDFDSGCLAHVVVICSALVAIAVIVANIIT